MKELTDRDVAQLEEIARRIRMRIVQTISTCGVGHPGGSLSAADILTTLYFHTLRIDPTNPGMPERDRFVLSKGHAASALYATMAERGFFPVEQLQTFGCIDSALQVHPDMHLLPGIEASTGALGQGISIALGMALAARLDGLTARIFCLLGDGECQEGQVWEAAEAAAHYRVDNLTVILDYNGVQLMGPLAEIMNMEPMAAKWRAFNWEVFELDGHDIRQIVQALQQARAVKGKPCILIAHTVKGKGVSFMEGQSAWHGKPPSEQELAQALIELQAQGRRT
jgi:transketolase